ncbi:MAG TPA: sigma-70 family RNA polymerase sigma factor [Acidobacteriota bacterium]|nr:sigma-70 family RNA polymerase sigma factor [Acidobacteriota bacterium]
METVIDLRGAVRQSRMATMLSAAEITDHAPLVGAARQGDRTAFGQLYRLFSPMVHGILLARVPRHDAEDLVQDVFLAALRQLHTLRDDAAFPGWLARIARNRATDHHRRRLDTGELPADVAAPNSPCTEALAVLATIRGLPEAYREPLILRLVEGMTGEEIAARTGLKPASVRVNLHRGMKRLREILGKENRP